VKGTDPTTVTAKKVVCEMEQPQHVPNGALYHT